MVNENFANTADLLKYAEHTVFLQLASRGTTASDMDTNRIGLKAETISITTSRTVPTFPIPMSGVLTGESLAMAMDMGMANKTVNISGIITEQTISKRFEDGAFATTADRPTAISAGDGKNNQVRVKMTAQEICQLIHSYVDSSFLQSQQNLNELVILIPTRVNKDYQYHSILENTANAESREAEDLPLIPFDYYVRDSGNDNSKLDSAGVITTIGASHFPKLMNTGSGVIDESFTSKQTCEAAGHYWNNSSNIDGMKGFIRNFNTTFVGGQPWVDFTLDFEIAQIGL